MVINWDERLPEKGDETDKRVDGRMMGRSR